MVDLCHLLPGTEWFIVLLILVSVASAMVQEEDTEVSAPPDIYVSMFPPLVSAAMVVLPHLLALGHTRKKQCMERLETILRK
eukprot:scaffold36388_cov46-Attheya_sp.AAC.1